MSQHSSPKKNPARIFIFIILIISGAFGIVIANTIVKSDPWHDIIQEFGVVLTSAFAISLIYEGLIAETHFNKFLEELKTLVKNGESINAEASKIGINKIYKSRRPFEIEFPLEEIVDKSKSGEEFFIIGRSLLLIMQKFEVLKKALTKGLHVKLCCYDPLMEDEVSKAFMKISEFRLSDVKAALNSFKTNFDEFNRINHNAIGSIEIKFHRTHIFDTFFLFSYGEKKLAIWDIGLGASVDDKPVFLLDGSGEFFDRLYEKRYNKIWNGAEIKFKYSKGNLEINDL